LIASHHILLPGTVLVSESALSWRMGEMVDFIATFEGSLTRAGVHQWAEKQGWSAETRREVWRELIEQGSLTIERNGTAYGWVRLT
jgi:hypothetical protein